MRQAAPVITETQPVMGIVRERPAVSGETAGSSEPSVVKPEGAVMKEVVVEKPQAQIVVRR